MRVKSLRSMALLVTLFGLMHSKADADEASGRYATLIPHPLLGLVHAPEVHRELKLSEGQIRELEDLLLRLDQRWFPGRNLPDDEQRTLSIELESEVWAWFDKSTTASQKGRLQQLEYYAQGSRLLLRDDIAKQLSLQPSQQQKLAVLARATDESKQALSRVQSSDTEQKSLQSKLDRSVRAERDGMKKAVRPVQLQALQTVLGEPFDPTNLRRVYAMAPELIPVEHWINSKPLTMRGLRGKVVLVHFYAFQCHNCHANFEIYRRWHRELTDKGVVVVGIQTPETARERDADAVTTAAHERRLSFPILIDLKSENWQAWGNTMWPCVYVVDKNGYVRMWWAGELNWKGATGDKTIEAAVDALLAEK